MSRSGLFHLVARLPDVVFSRRLAPLEQSEVAAYLRSPAERSAYWSQPKADQRHGIEAARWVASRHPDRKDLIRAALLHDVGKRHARSGPLRRTWTVLRGAMGRPPTPRMSSYLDHGRIGGDELQEAGAEPLVVAYTRHHHGERPDGISIDDWKALLASDRAFLSRSLLSTSRPQRPRLARLPPYDGYSKEHGNEGMTVRHDR